ncbi:MAG: T9SS type A sorting domain-containing protein [Bacteroidales bacterium]|nr:T9SS type A sorting domain-containing protein [Bacteroidales bacterium]MCF8456444.1 T9SS type A sorting domain-containing protein [Bacteroidales bacterium]
MKKIILFLFACIASLGLFAQSANPTVITLDGLSNLGPCGTPFYESGIEMKIIPQSGQDPCVSVPPGCDYTTGPFALSLYPGKLEVNLSGFLPPQLITSIEVDIVNWASPGYAVAYMLDAAGGQVAYASSTLPGLPETLTLINPVPSPLSYLYVAMCEGQILEIRIYTGGSTLPLSITGVVTNSTQTSPCNGGIDITVSDGVTPYTYLWSNGQTTEDLTNLCAGQYSVTTTDATGFWIDSFFDVFLELPMSVSGTVTHSTTQISCNGAIDITVAGGNPPYTYSWSNGMSSEDISNLCPGTYYVTAYGSQGGWVESFFDVYVNTGPVTNGFNITLNENGFPVAGGGTNNYTSAIYTDNYNGWYNYTITNWWNIWFYNGYDPYKYKTITIEFDLAVYNSLLPSYLNFAVNWSTDVWYNQGIAGTPPLPSLVGANEAAYIMRPTLQLWDQGVSSGHYEYCYVIPDYCPGWVSIDVQGYNFEITNGVITHECISGNPPPTGRCCYTDPNGNMACADNYECECDLLNGSWDATKDCTNDPCLPTGVGTFWIGMTGNQYADPTLTGGTNNFPGGINGWYDYPSGWWNIWFNNLPYTVNAYKEIYVSFEIEKLAPGLPFYVEFAVNYSTPTWDANQLLVAPPIPSNMGNYSEADVIVRDMVLMTDNASDLGTINYCLVIPDHCPGWVSIDVQGFNFKVTNGVIDHQCYSGIPDLGRCCYTDVTGATACADNYECECDLLGGTWDGTKDCTNDPCITTNLGACCIPASALAGYTCTNTTESNCLANGGTFMGIGTSCSTNPCPVENNFQIKMPPTGIPSTDPTETGGTDPFPGGINGWFDYPSGWWNIWFYDHPFDTARYKEIHVTFTVSPTVPNLPTSLDFAVNWSTPDWSLSPLALFGPPVPQTMPVGTSEDLFIERPIIYEINNTILSSTYQTISLCLFVTQYNPEWVSIDVMGSNFTITNGYIWHACLPGPPPNEVNAGPDVEICAGDCTTLTATGGATYQWSNGSTGSTISVCPSTTSTYRVTATDNNGCFMFDRVTVIVNPSPSVNLTCTNITCYGDNDGSIVAYAYGGTPPYTYSWSNGINATSLTGLGPGTYSVTVTDSNGCTGTASCTISEPPELNVYYVSLVGLLCHGDQNGAISLGVTGGVPPYSYAWSNGQTGQTATGLGAGTYYYTVTDANGCPATGSATILDPPAISISISSTNVSCYGGSNGSASATVSGGTPGYTYQWSMGAMSPNVSGLPAGTYTLTVYDANQCMATATVTITQPPALTIAMNCVNITCHGYNNGYISVSVSGGTPGYSYAWYPNVSTGTNAINLGPGLYKVTVTDTKGCTATAQCTITEPPLLTVAMTKTNVICNGDANGTATATPGGGTPPYSYNWSTVPPSTTQTISNLAPGIYTVTVTDAKGCTTTGSVTITQPPALGGTVTVINVTCPGGNDGQATANIVGGTPPYTYTWDGVAGGMVKMGLSAGLHTLVVKDANNCTHTINFVVTAPPAIFINSTIVDVDCFGNSTGSATVVAGGGTGPYVYAWVGIGPGNTITNMPAGIYTVVVTDSKGCTATFNITIIEPPALVLTETHVNPSAPGASDGSINLTVNGGTAPSAYSWSNGALTQDLNSLLAGTYCVTVTDSKNCAATLCVTLVDPACPSTNQFWVAMSSNWAPIPSLTGGTNYYPGGTNGWFEYASEWWNIWFCNLPFDTTAYKTIHVEFNVSVYQPGLPFYLKFALNYTKPAWDMVNTIMPPLPSNPTVVVNENQYIYREVLVNSNSASALGFHSYDIVIPNYCPGWVSIDVQGFNYKIENGIINHVCLQEQLGQCCYFENCTVACDYISESACQQLNGQWNPNLTCNDSCALQELSIVAVGTNPICNGSCNGTILANVTGGIAPYTVTWPSNSAVLLDALTPLSIGNLCAGTYILTVTDAIGCTSTVTVVLVDPPLLLANITGINPSNPGATNGSADLTVSGGTLPYNYLWNNGMTNEDLTGLSAGTYCVTVTDANGCIATACVTLVDPVCPSTNQFWIAMNSNYGIVPSLSGGTDYYPGGINGWFDYPSEWWNIWFCNLPFDSTGYKTIHVEFNVSVYEPGLPFYLKFAVNYSTPAWDLVNTTMPPLPFNPTVVANENQFIYREVLVNSTTIGASGFHSYDFVIPNYCPGWVSIDVQGFNFKITNGVINHVCLQEQLGQCCHFENCDVTCDYITESACLQLGGQWNPNLTCNDSCALEVLDLGLTGVNPTCSGACNGSITASINGGVAPYLLSWVSSSVNLPSTSTAYTITNLCAGTYTITVTDAIGCTSTATITLVDPPPTMTVYLSMFNPNCYGTSTGKVIVTVFGGTAPFTYLWNTGSTLPLLLNIPAGIYSVTITDANGCTATATATLVDPPMLVATIIGTNPSVTGATDGSADLTVSGGTPGYTYIWSNGATTEDLSGLGAGTYCVTVTDSKGCVATVCVTLVATICPTTNQFWIAMYPNLYPNPLLTGGTDYYPGGTNGWFEYPSEWWNIWFCNLPFDPTSYKQIHVEFNVSQYEPGAAFYLKFAVNYSTPTWDLNNLTMPPLPSNSAVVANESLYIFREVLLESSSSVSASGFHSYDFVIPFYCPGWVSIDVQGYNFKIENGVLNHVCLNEQLGQCCYWDSCTVACDYVSEADCNLLGGQWNPNLTCADNCPMQVLGVDLVGNNPLCNGDCNGSISAYISGGVPPYSISMVSPLPVIYPVSSLPYVFQNLCAGNYTIVVTDSLGCSVTQTVTLVDPPALVLALAGTDPSAPGAPNGSVDLTVSGGTPPYTYLWNNGAITQNLFGVTAGTYCVTVTDANGCTDDDCITLVDPVCVNTNQFWVAMTPNLNLDPLLTGGTDYFPGGINGWFEYPLNDWYNIWFCNLPFDTTKYKQIHVEFDVTKLNPTTPFYFKFAVNYTTPLWDMNNLYSPPLPSNPTVQANENLYLTREVLVQTDNFVQLGFHSYDFIIPDYCPGWVSIDVQGYNFKVTNGVLNHVCMQEQLGQCCYFDSCDVACAYVSETECQALGGAWDPYLTCTTTCQLTPMSIYTWKTDVDCFGNNTGFANVTVSGGMSPYSFLWSNGATTAAISNLYAGIYTVSVTDAAGCLKTATAIITQPLPISVAIATTDVSCYGYADGSAIATVTGGIPPYIYEWDGIPGGSSITGLPAGVHTFKVTDANGCPYTTTFDILEPAQLVLNLVGTNPSVAGASDGSVNLSITGGTYPYAFLWSNGATTADISGLPAGTYCVTVTDANGCIETGCVTLTAIACPSTNQFWIGMTGNNYPDPAITGGTDYYPGGVNGWFDYPSGWWNIWFCNLPYDTTAYKEIHVEFYVSMLTPGQPFSLEFAVNYTTPAWDENNLTMPPLPSNSTVVANESQYIFREVLLNSTTVSPTGFYSFNFVIPDYCPGWVSIDVQGFNFKIEDGVINHVCLQESLGQCCYVEQGQVMCAYVTEAECDSINGYWDVTQNCNDICLIPAPWGDPINTGDNHTILVADTVPITIDGIPIGIGDEISVFYDVNGTLVVGGTRTWNGSSTIVVAWGDDPQTTTIKDGFATGEVFAWKIWDASEAKEYDAVATYDPLLPSTDQFMVNGISSLVKLEARPCQTIIFGAGWDMVSTYINPDDPDLDVVLADIVANISIMKDELGMAFWPAWGINLIGDWTVGEGYAIKMVNPDTLVICGDMLNPATTAVDMKNGWGLFAYLCQTPQNVVTMLSPIVNNIVIVKAPDGTVYWPIFMLNTIGDFIPGKGYQAKMSAQANLYYQCGSGSTKSIIDEPSIKHFGTSRSTGNNMTLGIPLSAWEESPEIGDEVAVFTPQGELAGSSVFTGKHLAITIWGDDEYTKTSESLELGGTFSIRLWHHKSGKEEVIDVESWSEGNNQYTVDGISIAAKVMLTGVDGSSYVLYQNIPNPFKETTEIRFYLPKACELEIEVYNLLGEKVAVICQGEYEAGEHSVIFNSTKLKSGSYFYKLRTPDFTGTHAMSIIR